jgi:hypothetical protein
MLLLGRDSRQPGVLNLPDENDFPRPRLAKCRNRLLIMSQLLG